LVVNVLGMGGSRERRVSTQRHRGTEKKKWEKMEERNGWKAEDERGKRRRGVQRRKRKRGKRRSDEGRWKREDCVAFVD
jgi:hypothetical protein